MTDQSNKTKKELTAAQKEVLHHHGTERPWSGELLKNKEAGTYKCADCGVDLFSSETKYESHSGWPSFYDKAGNVAEHTDTSAGMTRVEVRCGQCDSHLGHVFPDGPKPTGLRYCINSIAMEFEKKKES